MKIRNAPSGAFDVLPSYPAVPDNVNVGAVASISWSKGPAQRLTMSQNCTVTFVGLPPNERTWAQLEIITNGFTPTFVNAITPAAAPLALSSAPGTLDVISVYWSGVRSLLAVAGLAFG